MAQHLRRFVPVVAGLALAFAPESALPQIWQTNSPTGATLYAFKGAPDGSGPAATLLVDKRGMIFGTTAGGGTSKACLGGCGTVFTLTPHGSDYVETTIYSFGGASNHDGEFPLGGLTEDASGALYGTTEFQGGGSGCQGLGCGIVYKLTPTRTGYAESVLYVFAGGADGEDPTGNVIIDAAGALYGTTVGGGYKEARCAPVTCGTVFKLTPAPGGGYTERVIHRFKGGKDGGLPYGGLIEDAAGALFGTTSTGGGGCSSFTCGTVFKLAPVGALGRSGYRKTTIHAFRGGANDGAQPLAGLVADAGGSLYGTTRYGGGTPCAENAGCGTVFKLIAAGAGFTESVIYDFRPSTEPSDGIFPQSPVVVGRGGTVYGTTLSGGSGPRGGDGIVFSLTPLRSGGYGETILLQFKGLTDGQSPMAGLAVDAHGKLFGTTDSGGSSGCNRQGCGVAFDLTP